MAEHAGKSMITTTIYSPNGSTITKSRPGSYKIITLPPSPEEEIYFEEPVVPDEEDLASMTDEVQKEENDDPDHASDVLQKEENDDPDHASDVIRIHRICDQPEINVEVPSSCYYCTLKAKPVSNEEKNEELWDMSETIKKKSEKLGTRDRSEMFKIEGVFDIDQEFKVMVTFDNDVSNQYLDFFAVVKSDNKWFEIPAETKNNQVIFKTGRMEYFFIMSSPKTTTMTLNSESDQIYQHESDPKIMVKFPKGSVENRTPIDITVLPVIPKQLETLKNDFETPIIEDMSPIMIVSQLGKSDFNRPIRCTLPCKPLASSEKRKTLMVKLDLDGQADVFEVKTKDNDNGTCSFEAKRINICSIFQTTQSISEDKYTMNKIRDQVLYVIGEAKRCILQTFWRKKERLIRTEIIQITNKRQVHEKMEKEGFRSVQESSKVITLRKGQRIRVDLTGRIQKRQTQKKFGLFVVFQPNLDTICMEFGFEIKKEMGTSLHGEITYSSDNYDKVVIDTVHFDPSKPSSARTSHCYPLSRERSALQDQQFVQTDRHLNIRRVSAQTEDIESRENQVISQQGSNLGSLENCPQNANSPLVSPVQPHHAEDIHGQVYHRNRRSKRSNGVHEKAPITARRKSINSQGRGKSARPQTAKYAISKNLEIQRSKTDVTPRATVSSPSQNAEMKMGTSLHGEITYSSDNYNKVVIDTVHFDPSKPSSARTSHCYPLSRERSALQDQQFVQTDRHLNIRRVSAQTEDIESRENQVISQQGSNLGSLENCPQNANSPLVSPVQPHHAEDIHGQVYHRNRRSKRSNGVHEKAPITARRKSINSQGHGKSARPQTEKYAIGKNLEIQRSKTDVTPRATVSSPSQNAEMNTTSPLQTEDVVYMRLPTFL